MCDQWSAQIYFMTLEVKKQQTKSRDISSVIYSTKSVIWKSSLSHHVKICKRCCACGCKHEQYDMLEFLCFPPAYIVTLQGDIDTSRSTRTVHSSPRSYTRLCHAQETDISKPDNFASHCCHGVYFTGKLSMLDQNFTFWFVFGTRVAFIRPSNIPNIPPEIQIFCWNSYASRIQWNRNT